ncbi:hypothetical protein WN943_027076 [Citrus x changshan-huyou]
MAELFIKQANLYAVARPNYPKELFKLIASKTPKRNLAWDVGTRSGQAAASAPRSRSVTTTPVRSRSITTTLVRSRTVTTTLVRSRTVTNDLSGYDSGLICT